MPPLERAKGRKQPKIRAIRHQAASPVVTGLAAMKKSAGSRAMPACLAASRTFGTCRAGMIPRSFQPWTVVGFSWPSARDSDDMLENFEIT